jgi:hypothetical protein
MHAARRTLVKSPPELWAEVSDPEALARHLGAFGEIRITRLDPEATVAWEGDRIRGTVDLAESGWGTKVTITAETVEEAPAPVAVAPEQEPEQEQEQEQEPATGARRGFWSRLFSRSAPELIETPEPDAVTIEQPAVTAGPEPGPVLDGMLDALGAAHHRPFTR